MYSIEREEKNAASKPPQKQPQQIQKPSAQDDLLDLLGDTNLNQGQKPQPANTIMK